MPGSHLCWERGGGSDGSWEVDAKPGHLGSLPGLGEGITALGRGGELDRGSQCLRPPRAR